MKKVYCGDCNHFKFKKWFNVDDLKWDTPLIQREEWRCNIIYNGCDWNTYKNVNCKFYKRKWWKVWVR